LCSFGTHQETLRLCFAEFAYQSGFDPHVLSLVVQRRSFQAYRVRRLQEARLFPDYDDPEEKPEENPKDSKRIKSGVLTPPMPEDLVMASTEESGGGFAIKHETDLEMGEIEEADGSKKYAYEDLDEMITQAQKEAVR
jgi:hypothetical protein